MLGFGIEFLKLLQSVRTDFFNVLFDIITFLGEDYVPVAVIISIYFAFDKHLAYKMTFSILASLNVNGISKNLLRVPRPFANGEIVCLKPDTATGYSFPSGHTQNFAAWSANIALNYKKLLHVLFSVVGTILVGFSRMYLGAHYPTDVIAGAMLGFVIAYICNLLYDRIQNKNKLHIYLLAFLTPFAVAFMINSDIHFEDFFKCYGMTTGFALSYYLECKFISLDKTKLTWKKIIRSVIAVIVAVAVKIISKGLIISDSIRIIFVSNTIAYFVLAFSVFYVCPLVYKKIKL